MPLGCVSGWLAKVNLKKTNNINMKKQEGYNHDVSKCITKIVKDARKNDPTIEWIDFELSTIQMFGVKPTKFKTGQPIKIYRKTKSGNEKGTKTFVAHSFCPFCGAKF